jgi:hypothetical protein
MRQETVAGLNSLKEQRMFIDRLTETIAWCRDAGLPSQPQESLRTCKVELDDLSSQNHQVFRVSLARKSRLWAAGKRDLPPVADLCGGRLLAYFPDDNLFCGTAEHETQGFFDVNNIPPYDTWVWMVSRTATFTWEDGVRGETDRNYLVAWIPPDFVELASAGIAVNPEECIQWLDTRDDAFVRSLRRIGLVERGLHPSRRLLCRLLRMRG